MGLGLGTGKGRRLGGKTSHHHRELRAWVTGTSLEVSIGLTPFLSK